MTRVPPSQRAPKPVAYTLRAYDPEADWEGICRVHDLARPLELQGSCDARAFVPLKQDAEGQQIDGCRVCVAGSTSGGVIGFAGVLQHYIGWLYLDPAYHGQGIGRALLREAITFAGPTPWTVCLRDNHPARSLYASEGLVVTETWEDENAGYACTVVRLQRPAP